MDESIKAPWTHFQAVWVFKADVTCSQNFYIVSWHGPSWTNSEWIWTAGGASSHPAANTVSSYCSTSSSSAVTWDSHLGLSRILSLHTGAQPLPASPHRFRVSYLPCCLLCISSSNAVVVQNILRSVSPSGAPPGINNPRLCQTGHWGEATKPFFNCDLYYHWFHGLCVLQVEGGMLLWQQLLELQGCKTPT